MTSLLSRITGPGDLRALAPDELCRLAAEIREHLVASVSQTGGHLGPNLGVVELTIALHRVFRSPADAIVWDTGHQAYVHKLLTGRQAQFPSLRQAGGISGYPSRRESVHDLVENSHASTALSYADGLAKAAALGHRSCPDPDAVAAAAATMEDGVGDGAEPQPRSVVAVVGDGALTGGMCWEALNNLAAAPERPVVIVLNDNGRSYAPTAGSLPRHLAALHHGDGSASIFEQLGLVYLGPVDGHDIEALEAAFRKARDAGVPVVVHCRTRKGAGFAPAETDEADRLHAVNPVPPAGRAPVALRRTWTEAFGEELLGISRKRTDVVAVTAAMLRPTGLLPLATEHPERVYDVGIAEQHAVTSAAGLAMAGMHPVVCVYATFLNRAVDQMLMDVALHRLPVTFVLDRAGVTGSDGPSHNGMWDLSLLGMVPGMRVAAPRDAVTLGDLLGEAVQDASGPTALRFPKGDLGRRLPACGRLGEADVLTRSTTGDVLVLAVGPLAEAALTAAEELARCGIAATVVDPRWVLPVGPEIAELASRHKLVVTAEDNGEAGGFGDAVARALRAAGVLRDLRTLALPQAFLEQGSRGALLAEHGLDAAGITATVRTALGSRRAVRAMG